MKHLAGSIILHRTKGILPWGIRLFMGIFGRKTGKGKRPEHNHAEILVWHDGELKSLGAIKGGARLRPVKYSLEEVVDYAVFKPKEPFTESEQIELEQVAEWTYVYNYVPYQVTNFVSWIGYIFKGKWIGRDSPKRQYCYELVARVTNKIRPDTFPDPERTDIFQFYNHADYVEIDVDLKKIV